jgi:hypothetical protein
VLGRAREPTIAYAPGWGLTGPPGCRGADPCGSPSGARQIEPVFCAARIRINWRRFPATGLPTPPCAPLSHARRVFEGGGAKERGRATGAVIQRWAACVCATLPVRLSGIPGHLTGGGPNGPRRSHFIRCPRSEAPYGLPGCQRSAQQSSQLPRALGRHRKALGSTPKRAAWRALWALGGSPRLYQ